MLLLMIELFYQHPFHLLITNDHAFEFRILMTTFGSQIAYHKTVMIKDQFLFIFHYISILLNYNSLNRINLTNLLIFSNFTKL